MFEDFLFYLISLTIGMTFTFSCLDLWTLIWIVASSLLTSTASPLSHCRDLAAWSSLPQYTRWEGDSGVY